MGAPDRTRVGATAKLRSDTLTHRLGAGIGERGLALLADQIAGAWPGGGERTRTIEPVAAALADSAALAAKAS